MKIATFRKNLLKTVRTKTIKSGLKQVAKNAKLAVASKLIADAAFHTDEIFRILRPYIVGEKGMSAEMTQDTIPAFGALGADIALLSKIAKVKTPTSTKRIKLEGTRTAALLLLQSEVTALNGEILGYIQMGPSLKTETKLMVLPNKGGAKEEREVQVIDRDMDLARQLGILESMKPALESLVDVYWRLSFDMYKQGPAFAFDAYQAMLQVAHPEVVFESDPEPVEKVLAAK